MKPAESRGRGAPSTTIAEVARHAGVSPSTVSYVLSGERRISEPTRARVERSIEELNYRPHAGARSLRAGKANAVALIFPSYDWSFQPVVMPYVYGVTDAARAYGWNVILVTGEAGVDDVDSIVRSKMVDRAVLMDVQADDPRLVVVEQAGIPAVAMGLPRRPLKVPFVDFDFEAAGRTSVEHLVACGHRRLGLLAHPPAFGEPQTYARRLWDGASKAVAEAGLRFLGLPLEPTMSGAATAVDALFAEQPGLDALIIHNESMVDLVLRVLGQRGKAVPADISVMAVAWRELVKHISPPVTYVEVPSVEIGRTAIRLLATGEPSTLLPAVVVPGATVARRAA